MTIYKLNPWLLAATLLLFAKISFSQKDSLLKCKDTDKQGIYYNNTIAYLKKKENLRPQLKYPINVALSVKLIRKSDGSGGIDESQVRRVIDNLNSVYLQANIGFFLLNDKVEFINNDNYYVFNTEDEDKLTSKYDVRNAINLYLVNSFEESIGGYAYFPSTMKNSNRVFCYYADVEDMIYKVVPHEMGHYFGLFHTFQGNFSVDEELVSRGENGNCEFAGDLICDTPADPYGKVIFLGGVDCGFNYIFTDKSGENYHPQTGNLMSYYRNCGNFFTPGQYELLSYGISKRLAPNTNSEVRYNILGRQEIDSTLITTGKLQSKDGGIYNSSICRNQEVYLSYTLKSKKNIPVEAWLITDNNKIRIKVGEGTESPLKLNFEKLPSIPFNFFLQVVATDESQFGTFSDQYYKLLEIPKIEIQGSDEIFKGEQAVILVKINTAIANFKILNEYNEGVNYFHSGIPNKIQLKIPTSNSSQFKITSVSNECGVGTGTGVFDVKIIPVPLSKFVKLYRQDDFICKGRDLQFTVVGDGKIPEIKAINLVENDSQNGKKITSYSLSNDLLTIPAAEIQNSFAERFSLVIDFENLGIVSSKIIHKLSDINLDLSQVVKFKRGKEYKINLPGYYTPTEVLLSNNNSLNISGNAAFLSFVLFENQTINISKSNTNGCQVVNLTGTIQFKTDDLLEFDMVRKEEVCVNQKISLPVSKIQGIFGNQPTVIFYDELNRQSSGTSSHLSNENILTFVIPETLKSDGYYYFRIMTVDSLLSKKSNLFYINTLPNINISGVYSSKYQNQNLIKEVKGTLPIEVIFDDDKTFKIFTTNDILSPSNFSEGQHNIKQLKNICGTFSPNQIFVIANEIPSPNCTSIGNPDKYFIPVSKFEISQQYQDNMPVFSREDWPHQTNGYNDFTNKIIYLKKNTPYNFYLETYVEKNLSYGSTNYTQLKSWIDYNNNGVFEDKEEIIYSTEAFRTKKTIIIPENVKPGFRLLRIKTISQNSTSYKWDACTADGTGEIEDYLISIQEPYMNIPFLNINVNTDKLCITRKLGFIISASNLGHNSFKVSLKDKWGNIIQDLGYYPAGFHETTIKYPVNSNEFLSLMVEDEKNQLQVSSKNFYVIFPPKLTLLGESFGGTGQAQNIFYKCQNGYNTIVTINNAVGNNQFGVYQNYIKNSLNSFSAVINKSGNVYPVAIFDAVCGVGHIEGFTKVTVFDAEPNSKAFSNQSGYGYARCSDGWSINYELNSNIPNEDKNFFSGLLMNENGEFMKNMGNYTKKDIRLSNNTLLPDGMYYANLFAHNPMKSIILDYYDVYKKPKFSMPNNSYNFFVGETGLFEINFNTERTSFNLELSQFQSISAGFVYRFTKKITPSDMVSANSVPNSYYCPATGGTLKQNILAKNKEKNQLKIIADNQFCAGGKTSVPYFKIRSFETDNSFEYSLLDSKNNIVETGNAKEKDGTIK